jgi:hypothetical protein
MGVEALPFSWSPACNLAWPPSLMQSGLLVSLADTEGLVPIADPCFGSDFFASPTRYYGHSKYPAIILA